MKTVERHDIQKQRHRIFLKDMIFGKILKRQAGRKITIEVETMVLQEVDNFL
jgi:hypothetical protein